MTNKQKRFWDKKISMTFDKSGKLVDMSDSAYEFLCEAAVACEKGVEFIKDTKEALLAMHFVDKKGRKVKLTNNQIEFYIAITFIQHFKHKDAFTFNLDLNEGCVLKEIVHKYFETPEDEVVLLKIALAVMGLKDGMPLITK